MSSGSVIPLRVPGRAAALLGLVFAFAGAGCADDEPAPSTVASDRPSFLVVSLDTTRADHLGLYGYERDTTPHLDGLAERALVFEQMAAVSVNTLISHASLFTGLFPLVHSASPIDGDERGLNPACHTLAEDLARAGYQTAGFTSHDVWLSPRFGMDQGFERFTHGWRDADEVLGDAREFLAERDPSRPFFLFVHLFDVHSDDSGRPYGASAPFEGRFTSGYDGPLSDWRLAPKSGSAFLHAVNAGEITLDAADVSHLRDQYDEGLAETDDRLGRFLEELDPAAREQAYVVVTADHGEEFFEHGKFLHTFLYDEVIRVPLIIAPPLGREHPLGEPRRIGEQVSLVDLRPTLLALAGLDDPELNQGANLVPWLSGRTARSPAGPVLLHPQGVRYDGYKLIRSKRDGVLKVQLYDLLADPAERSDLADDPAQAGRVDDMGRALDDLKRRHLALRREILDGVAESRPELEDAEREILHGLGYLDGAHDDDADDV